MSNRPSTQTLESLSQAISIPYNYVPRDYQLPFWYQMKEKKNAVLCWHRRSGKDKTCLNFILSRMLEETGGKIGTYFYLLPTYAQAKKIVWDGMDGDSFRVLHHFPPALVRQYNESELQVTLHNGSIFQLIGTDKIDSIVGTNPLGCVFSEYALQNPRAYDLLSPILLENGGFAVFNFTPRGRNHAYKLYEGAKKNPNWYCSLFTVNDTKKADGTPVMNQQAVAAERQRLIDQGKTETDADSFIQQEYYCSFEGFQEGAYYQQQIQKARADRRMGRLPWVSSWPVYTFWDLGVGDACSIWFAQRNGNQLLFIDYYENTGEAVGHYAKVLREKPYTYARHFWPHDGRNRDFGGTGQTRRDTGEGLGIRPIDIIPRGDVEDGIDAVRRIFSQCYFDETRCEKGLNALTEYCKEWDEDRKEYKNKPYHNWASHGADAFRTMAKSEFWLYGATKHEPKLPSSWMSA